MTPKSPRPAPCASPRERDVDLERELALAIGNLTPEAYLPLKAIGVPRHLCVTCDLVGIARVDFRADTYDPNDDGEPALIIAVRGDGRWMSEITHPNPRAAALIGPDVIDLVATSLADPTKFRRRLGVALTLGYVLPRSFHPPRARIHRTPRDWLAADADGFVILERGDEPIAQALVACPAGISTPCRAYGAVLQRVAQRPRSSTPIFLEIGERKAAA